jgi:ring-1,2-phenylacetyl-CoA epoxidase subunit PaaE
VGEVKGLYKNIICKFMFFKLCKGMMKRLMVLHIKEETYQARSLILEPLDDWIPEYKAGQFLTLIFKTKHGEKRRSYSISSSAAASEPLTITVKKQDNGEFSRYIIQHVKPGDILTCSGISGFFVLPENPENYREICFIAAGSGITPCYSIIKTLLKTTSCKVTLIYSNKSKANTIFYNNLIKLMTVHEEKFKIKFLFSDSSDIYSRRLGRWLLDQLISTMIIDPGAALYYVCGPFDYMQTVEITLRMYTGPQNIIKENFSALPRLVLPAPPDKEEHIVTIEVDGKTHKVKVKFPESILASAKKTGLEIPYSCEAGRCGSCVATCTSGKIWMAYNEVLVDKEIEKGRILTCQGFPVFGDASIKID